MQKIAVFAAIALLSGCATCQHHPVWCATGVAVLGTSAALSFKGTGGTDTPPYRKPIIR